MHHLQRRYELSASLYQLAVLLCFNQQLKCNLSEIRHQTGLITSDLIKTVKVRNIVVLIN
jgi:hypothetical protein